VSQGFSIFVTNGMTTHVSIPAVSVAVVSNLIGENGNPLEHLEGILAIIKEVLSNDKIND